MWISVEIVAYVEKHIFKCNEFSNEILLTNFFKEFEKLILEMARYVEAISKGRPSQPRLNNLRSKYRTNLKHSF